MTVSSGIAFDKEQVVRNEILHQLEQICQGQVTEEELLSAKQAICSSLRGTHDSPGAIKNYYATSALSGLGMTPQEYIGKVQAVTVERVAEAAKQLKLDTTYFLEGVQL